MDREGKVLKALAKLKRDQVINVPENRKTIFTIKVQKPSDDFADGDCITSEWFEPIKQKVISIGNELSKIDTNLESFCLRNVLTYAIRDLWEKFYDPGMRLKEWKEWTIN